MAARRGAPRPSLRRRFGSCAGHAALISPVQAGLKGTLAEPLSPHGLRAGFVTTAYRNGMPDEEIMGHTRHRSLITMRSYVRRAKLSKGSPAGKLGL
jgi:integrase